jgi:Right handed beta helix region
MRIRNRLFTVSQTKEKKVMARQVMYLFVAACGVAFVQEAQMAQAGDLNPPPGPVGATGRFGPRTEISASKTPGDANSSFKITEPGSYYLADNITGEAGKHGIEITASNVTLDLNGFALIGVTDSLNGVDDENGNVAVAVMNGSVSNWSGRGVNHGSKGGCVTKIRSHHNGTYGILANDSTVVDECTAVQNGSDGIRGAHFTLVRNCISRSNGGNGIFGGSGFTVLNCVAVSNVGDGIHLETGSSTLSFVNVNTCTSSDNGGVGINLSVVGIVTNSIATQNVGGGISASNSLIRGNTAVDNTGFNINCAGGSTCIENHAP